jgi:hypothetical protein
MPWVYIRVVRWGRTTRPALRPWARGDRALRGGSGGQEGKKALCPAVPGQAGGISTMLQQESDHRFLLGLCGQEERRLPAARFDGDIVRVVQVGGK